jgi:hypothetical protein
MAMRRLPLLITLVAVLFGLGCGEKDKDAKNPPPPRIPISQLLSELRSDQEEVRKGAREHVFNARWYTDPPLSDEECVQLLRAAAEPLPGDPDAAAQLAGDLIGIVATHPKPAHLPLVVELFPGYPPPAQRWAFVLLAALESRDADAAVMDILRTHAHAGRVREFTLSRLHYKPRNADIFFPHLFEFTSVPALQPEIYRLCLAYCNEDVLGADELAPLARRILEDYEELATQLFGAQQSDGTDWMWEATYSTRRNEAGVMLDLLSYLPADDVEYELRRALRYRDPHLQYHALQSLLRIDCEVPDQAIAQVAASAETRTLLFDELKERKQLDRMPARFRTQEALAESDLVCCLIPELDRTPHEIELLKVVPVDTRLPGGIYDYYVFRFRMKEPHWAAKDGWLAGLSGPFLRSECPTTNALGDTYSEFQPCDSKTPEEHVGDLRKLGWQWRRHFRERGKEDAEK